MKKKIAVLVSVLLMLGFTMAFANTAGRITDGKSMSSCCCKGDSCPMKDKDKTSADTKSCFDNCDCCKGDSCPMKMKHDQMSGMTMPMTSDVKADDAKSCRDNCDCCKGDDCPMKMKHDQKDGMIMPMAKDARTADAKSCGCSCCNHDKDAPKPTGR